MRAINPAQIQVSTK